MMKILFNGFNLNQAPSIFLTKLQELVSLIFSPTTFAFKTKLYIKTKIFDNYEKGLNKRIKLYHRLWHYRLFQNLLKEY